MVHAKKPPASQAANVELGLGLMLGLLTVSADSGTCAAIPVVSFFYIFTLIIKRLVTLSELRMLEK